MVLAERIERDVLDDHHLRVADVEDRGVDEPVRVDVVARGQLGVHPVDAVRRPDEALPAGVLADLDEDVADGLLDPPVPVPAVGHAQARALDGRGEGGLLGFADLGLDLGDELADVLGQAVCHAGILAPSGPKPPAGIGSSSRPSAPRSQARAFSPSDGRW